MSRSWLVSARWRQNPNDNSAITAPGVALPCPARATASAMASRFRRLMSTRCPWLRCHAARHEPIRGSTHGPGVCDDTWPPSDSSMPRREITQFPGPALHRGVCHPLFRAETPSAKQSAISANTESRLTGKEQTHDERYDSRTVQGCTCLHGGSATRRDLEVLLWDVFGSRLSDDNKSRKLSNLLTKMRRREQVKNDGTQGKALWRAL